MFAIKTKEASCEFQPYLPLRSRAWSAIWACATMRSSGGTLQSRNAIRGKSLTLARRLRGPGYPDSAPCLPAILLRVGIRVARRTGSAAIARI